MNQFSAQDEIDRMIQTGRPLDEVQAHVAAQYTAGAQAAEQVGPE